MKQGSRPNCEMPFILQVYPPCLTYWNYALTYVPLFPRNDILNINFQQTPIMHFYKICVKRFVPVNLIFKIHLEATAKQSATWIMVETLSWDNDPEVGESSDFTQMSFLLLLGEESSQKIWADIRYNVS